MMRRAWPILRDYTMITIGALLAALAVDFFLAPNNVIIGGITGSAMSVSYTHLTLPTKRIV